MAFDKNKWMNEYKKDTLKRIPLDVKKEKFIEIQEHAQNGGESVNGFIKRAIDETMERDNSRK
ncbi:MULTISPECIES: hypothetical protein [unclassified Butyrivibrio]|uniref:hypothetical protein n=1 Tax=unclassified Butyrivibrio TaxID=2639466 RepID=UPI0003F7AD7D|nr:MULTISPECIES: hypothetical protein [unclassified Butyrivibrio]